MHNAYSLTGNNFTWHAFLKIFDLPQTSIPLVKECHKRPLRDIFLQLESEEEIIIDVDVFSKLREIQATVI